MDRYSLNKKQLLNELTASGACRMRRDLASLKKIKRAQGQSEIILTKSLRAALFPWDKAKIRSILSGEIKTVESGMPLILGKIVPLDLINSLFSKSSAYQRLSKMDYEKTSEYVVRKRNENVK